MKHNKIIYAVIVAALSVTCYSAYHIYSANKRTYNPHILENVEALAALPEVEKIFRAIDSDCPPPVEYKRSRICLRGKEMQDCHNSDC